MTSLVQISEEDPWVAAAGYVGSILEQLEVRMTRSCRQRYSELIIKQRIFLNTQERSDAAKGDSEKFVKDVEIAYGKEDLSQVLDLFLLKLDIVFKNAENEQGMRLREPNE